MCHFLANNLRGGWLREREKKYFTYHSHIISFCLGYLISNSQYILEFPKVAQLMLILVNCGVFFVKMMLNPGA